MMEEGGLVDDPIMRGWDAYHRLELEDAQQAFEEAIADEPEIIDGHHGLARTLIRMRREDDARREVERCLALGPDTFVAHALAGLFHFLVDALEDAKESLQKAIELAPDDVEPYVVLAQVYADQQAFTEADAALERARQLIDTLDDEVVQRRERAALLHAETYVALSAGREDEARAKAEEALAFVNDNPHAVCLANTNLGLMAARRKRWDEAVAHLNAALDLNPSFYRARSALGRVYLVSGRPTEAAEALGAALAVMPRPDAHTVMAYASALSKTGHREEAVSQYRRALGMRPTWVERVYASWQTVWQSRSGRIAVIALGLVGLVLWIWLGSPSPQAITLVLLVLLILVLQRSAASRQRR